MEVPALHQDEGPNSGGAGHWRPGRRLALAAPVGAVVLLIGALVVAMTGSNGRGAAQGASAVTAFPASSREATGRAGWAALDYGFLRLYTPPGWAAVSLCTPVASGAEASGQVVTVGGSLYQVSTDEFLLRPGAYQPRSCVPPRSGGWAVVEPLAGGPPRGWRPSAVNGIAVWAPVHEVPEHEVVAVPSLHMELVAAGAGRDVLATLGPSSLAVLVDDGRGAAVPTSWKAVRFDGLQASVPPSWPVEVVNRQDPEPGVCDGRMFRSPAVYLGSDGFFSISCGLVFGPQLAPPVDGLWVFTGRPELGDEFSKALGFGALRPVLDYSYTATDPEATLQLGYAGMQAVVGLGKGPTTAEEVISSLRLTDLANSASTPTTPPGPGTPTTQVCPAGCPSPVGGVPFPTTTG